MNDLDMTDFERHQVASPEARAQVVADLADGYTATEAAMRVGATSATIKRWRDDDPEFDAECEAAYRDSTDVLEREARARALDREDSQSAMLLKFLIAGRHTRWGLAQKEKDASVPAIPPIRPMPDTVEVARRITYLLDEGARKLALQKAEGKVPPDEEL